MKNRADNAIRPASGFCVVCALALVGQASTDDVASAVLIILGQTVFGSEIVVFRLVGQVLAFDEDLQIVIHVIFGRRFDAEVIAGVPVDVGTKQFVQVIINDSGTSNPTGMGPCQPSGNRRPKPCQIRHIAIA